MNFFIMRIYGPITEYFAKMAPVMKTVGEKLLMMIIEKLKKLEENDRNINFNYFSSYV